MVHASKREAQQQAAHQPRRVCAPQNARHVMQVLRETLRCTLPVEVAWQGPHEMDDATLAALQDKFGPLRGFDMQAMPYPAHMKLWVWPVSDLLVAHRLRQALSYLLAVHRQLAASTSRQQQTGWENQPQWLWFLHTTVPARIRGLNPSLRACLTHAGCR